MRGPLGDDANVYVIARDRAKHRILIGGLGALGVGQMWFDEEARHATYAGYAEAAEENEPAPLWLRNEMHHDALDLAYQNAIRESLERRLREEP